MLLQIDSEFLFLYFFSHKNEPQNQHKCLVLSVLIASRYAAHAHAAWKLKGTGYEHLQFFPKSVLPFKHLYNLASCYYHARVRLIFFVTRVTNIHFLLKITSCWGILLSAPFETSFYNNWMTSRALIGRELCSIMVFDNTMCWIYARSDWSLPWSIWGQVLGWRHRKLVSLRASSPITAS